MLVSGSPKMSGKLETDEPATEKGFRPNIGTQPGPC